MVITNLMFDKMQITYTLYRHLHEWQLLHTNLKHCKVSTKTLCVFIADMQ